MASDLCIERNDSKWKIRDSPAKKQRCEDYGSPPPLCSSAEEEKEKEDPRSKVIFYNYDDSDMEDDSDGRHEVDLLKGQKSDKVDVTLQLEELEVMNNVLHANKEEEKLRSQREDFSDMVAENEKKRKRKMQEKDGKLKKKDFKF
ncbi:unnamed protein product [Camellia sinensis]